MLFTFALLLLLRLLLLLLLRLLLLLLLLLLFTFAFAEEKGGYGEMLVYGAMKPNIRRYTDPNILSRNAVSKPILQLVLLLHKCIYYCVFITNLVKLCEYIIQ